ncbi:MAG: molybdopterin molybdotransferase MoeA, partial [Pseudomonadota bacterium]
VTARRDHPPFAASAMDGYAVGDGDHTTWTVIGESAAGLGFAGPVAQGQAVRIFTGAPLPLGTTRVIIQEDVTRTVDHIALDTPNPDAQPYVRPAGADFAKGFTLTGPRDLRPQDIALLAAMGVDQVPVIRRPVVAIIGTGDELVQPGETPGPDQIYASNTYGIAALVTRLGAQARLLPVARDELAALKQCFTLAQGADLIVTIGGASVGDHDLVAQAAQDMGLEQQFYKIAMRPGKPLMAGRMGPAVLVGLPGNPVSAMVCGHVFLAPMIRHMLGHPATAPEPLFAPLTTDLPANGPRAHYRRAILEKGHIMPIPRQDSALLTILTQANTLLIQPAHSPELPKGTVVPYLWL